MDNDSETNVNTGEVKNFMYGKEVADQMDLPYEVDDTVNIPRGEYEELLDDSVFLECLRRAGVDNWDGWDYALEIYDEEISVKENREPPKLSLVE